MQYIGKEAITKLISLIKGDLATKQDSITATGVLERDTTGVINGVETVGATLVETQEATLVDVPNGLLKGDGTTISAAVAGTDYVNSSQAIRYDAAQSLTDAQKTQARANIAAAPDGFGLGNGSVNLTSSDNLDNVTGNGWYYWGSSIPANAPALINATASSGYCAMFMIDSSQIAVSDNDRNNMAMRTKNIAGWTPWEYINPPLKLGVEYRTTERYQGKPVYVKVVDFGAMPNATTKSVAFLIENNNQLLECKGFLSGGSVLPYSYPGSSVGTANVYTNRNSGNFDVFVSTDMDMSGEIAYFILKYTKTTD